MSSLVIRIPPGFLRLTGIALAGAGALTFLINAALSPLFPPGAPFAETAVSSLFAWRQGLSALAAVSLVFGSVGLYLAQAERLGGFGAVAFIAACVGSMLLLATEWFQIFLVPELASVAPEVLNGLDQAEGLSRYTVGFLIALAAFTLGWLAFAATTLRAGVFSRRGPILLIAGFFAIPILGGLLPGMWGLAAGNAVLAAGWILLGREMARMRR